MLNRAKLSHGKTLVLHIGFHKTGTTAIQSFLSDNTKALLREGILYPAAGRGAGSHGLLANLLKPENNRLDEGRKCWSKVEKEILRSTASTAILSSECFVESRKMPQVLSPMLEGWRVKLIVYLRRQDHWIQSVFNEVVTDSMRRHVGSIKDLREFRAGYLSYDEILADWESVVDPDDIIVRPFEREQFVGGDIRSDFMSALDLDVQLVPSGKKKDDVKNPSMPPQYIEFLRRCNLIPMRYDQHRALVDDLRRICADTGEESGGGHAWLAGKEKIALIEQFKHCNSSLQRRYLPDASSLFLEPFPVSEADALGVDILDSQTQHRIYDQLSKVSRKMLESNSPGIRGRAKGKPFLRKPSEEDAPRLRQIIMRQRHELRMLYRQTGVMN